MRITSPSVGRMVLLGIGGWLTLFALVLFEAWPRLPQSWKGWLMFAAIGPPSYIALEILGGRALSEKHSHAISQKHFSWLRILVLVTAVLAIAVACWYFSWLLSK